MKGFSILISTWNNLEYLKASVNSIRVCSALDNEICVYNDGSTDGTHEWLAEQPDLKYIHNPKWTGSLTGRNLAGELATRKYVFLSEDGLIYPPFWDKKIDQWVKKLGPDTFIIPDLVEARFGKSPDSFNKGDYLEYVHTKSRSTYSTDNAFGLPFLRRDIWEELGGHDTNFDPYGFGVLDFKLRAKQRIPHLQFARVKNVILYHFPSASWKHLKGTPGWESKRKQTEKYFKEKWGFDTGKLSEVYGYLLRKEWVPEKGVIVFTFDDGYLTTYENAFPILERYGLKATAFISTGLVHPNKWNEKETMKWSQIKFLYDNGWDIESHLVTHPWLKHLPPEEQEKELSESKQTLIDLGFDPVGLSYCYGDWGNEDENGHNQLPVPDLIKKYYNWGRKVTNLAYTSRDTDPYQITGVQMPDQDYTLSETFDAVDEAIERGGALVLVLHRVREGKGSLITSMKDLESICKYVKSKILRGTLRCLTLKELMEEWK